MKCGIAAEIVAHDPCHNLPCPHTQDCKKKKKKAIKLIIVITVQN